MVWNVCFAVSTGELFKIRVVDLGGFASISSLGREAAVGICGGLWVTDSRSAEGRGIDEGCSKTTRNEYKTGISNMLVGSLLRSL